MPNWVNASVFYHIYPLGFCGAPEYNDGQVIRRLDKLADWIPHLKKLQVNALYIGPLFEASRHGYDTRDYYKVDQRLGDNTSFKALCSQLHANGIRVVLDGVFNHVGREFWAFKDVQEKREASPCCGWFQNLHFNACSPAGDPFWYEGWNGHYDLVKLNLKHPDVIRHLLGAVEMWMNEFHIDGLRLDAADCVDPDFFRQLHSFCKAKNPDFWLMGEIIHGDYTRWANPEMLDSVTNYECYKGIYSSHNDHNYFEIAHSLQRQFAAGGIYKGICTYNFVDNHDVNRIADNCRNTAHLKNVYTILYTMPGVPSIYYGSEWAVHGTRSNQSDQALRPCLELGCTTDDGKGLEEYLCKLGKARRALKPLQYGDFENIIIKNEQLVYARRMEGQTIYIALNLADSAQQVDFRIDEGFSHLTDVLTGESFSGDDSHHLPLAACSARILVLHNGGFSGLTGEQAAILCDDEPEKPPLPDIPVVTPGRYRHYKGGEYEVLGIAQHSETKETMVVYKALYEGGGLWVRPYDLFIQSVESNGHTMLRFTKIDEL